MSDTELIDNVRNSTEAALKALHYFHQSLLKARMRESGNTYRSMCNTLVGQRIWMLDKDDPDVEKNFRELSAIAQDIVEVLQPYVTSFEKLIAIEPSNSSQDTEDSSVDPCTPEVACRMTSEDAVAREELTDGECVVVEVLQQNKCQASVTKVRAQSKLRKQEFDHVLGILAAKNRIAAKTVGGRKMLKLL